MKKKILIFSSGPAGKEVLFLINEINKKIKDINNFKLISLFY